MLVACVGGGKQRDGAFLSVSRRPVEMVGVEAAGHGIKTCKHAATLGKGSVGVLHGSKSYVLQDEYGQIKEAHSVSAGLDYPGVGPEHAWLKDSGRVRYEAIDDGQALSAFQVLCSLEGIIPALVEFPRSCPGDDRSLKAPRTDIIIVNLSGRGDKDLGNRVELFSGKELRPAFMRVSFTPIG